RGRSVEIRHARIFSARRNLTADRQRQDPQTRARRDDRARRAAADARAMARQGDGLMPLSLTRRDEVAILVLDRPEVLNALSFAFLEEIADAFDAVAKM